MRFLCLKHSKRHPLEGNFGDFLWTGIREIDCSSFKFDAPVKAYSSNIYAIIFLSIMRGESF
jgi:hypothetical protein